MATLTVWSFPDAFGADDAETLLKGLRDLRLITIHDAAVVAWPAGNKQPTTRRLASRTGAGALGVLFFKPFRKPDGATTVAGIDEEFVRSVRETVTPGTSALFLLSSQAVIDEVRDAFAGKRAELVMTNLSNEQERALREIFAR
jgi:uncharacterized membrane protein